MTPALSALADRSVRPTEADLAAVLGPAHAAWTALVHRVAAAAPPVTGEWKHYGRASGWCLLLRRRTRTLLSLFPQQGRFTVLFVFGERAVRAAYDAGLPAPVLASISAAVRHVEGRSFRLEVHGDEDLGVVEQLVAIKCATDPSRR